MAAALSSCHGNNPKPAPVGPPINAVCISPDGKVLASGGKDISIWDVAGHTRDTSLDQNDQFVTSLAFSPDGRTLATAGVHGTITLWDASSFARKASFTVGTDADPLRIVYSPDGKILAAGLRTEVKLIESASNKVIRILPESGELVSSIAFSADGRTLASGDLDAKVRLWDVASGKNLAVLDGKYWIGSVAFSRDGQTLIWGDADGAISFWDIRTASEIASINAHGPNHTVDCLAVSGNTLASCSNDGSIKLWDIRTRKQLLAIQAHTYMVSSLSFALDGKRLASGSYDGTAKLWDATTGALLAVFRPDHKDATEANRPQ